MTMNKLMNRCVIILLGLGYGQFDGHARVLVDPFSGPAHAEQTKPSHPLQAYPWYDYRLAGTLLNQRHGWALLCSPAAQCWRLTVGDRFGSEPRRITRIELTSIVLKPVQGAGSMARLTLDKQQ
jgi:Tfp pilus assembly protein PilP